MRKLLKSLGEKALLGLRVDAAARLFNRHRTLILAYHNIVPRGESGYGDPSLHLPQEQFSHQLDLLGRTHEIVSVSSFSSARGVVRQRLARPRAAITFDDAYRGALTAGMEEMHSRGLPATVFAAPGLLGDEGFWWDQLAAANQSGMDSTLREHALTTLGGQQEKVLQWARSEDLLDDRPVPEHARPADLELLRSMVGDTTVTLASHGWRHSSLPDVSSEEVDQELSRPVEWFRTHGIPSQPWLAFPYGRHTSVVRNRASNVYSLAFTTVRGYAADSSEDVLDSMRVPRVNVPAGISLDRFRLLTAGIFDILQRGRL